jgi:hypothetical protein
MTDVRKQMTEDGWQKNSEVGMRPPAHRAYAYAPAGIRKVNAKGKRHGASAVNKRPIK